MQHPKSLTEALEASMVVQAAFPGASGDVAAWREWESNLNEKAFSLPLSATDRAMSVADWETFLALVDLLNDRETFTDGREEIHVLAIEDGYVVWDTVGTIDIRVFAGAAVDVAVHNAPEYGYAPPDPEGPGEEPYDDHLTTDVEAEFVAMTFAEAADALNTSPQRIGQLIDEGKLKEHGLPRVQGWDKRRGRLVTIESVEAYNERPR